MQNNNKVQNNQKNRLGNSQNKGTCDNQENSFENNQGTCDTTDRNTQCNTQDGSTEYKKHR